MNVKKAITEKINKNKSPAVRMLAVVQSLKLRYLVERSRWNAKYVLIPIKKNQKLSVIILGTKTCSKYSQFPTNLHLHIQPL